MKRVTIHIQLGAETVSDEVPTEDLPENWDELDHDAKSAALVEARETMIANYVNSWFTES